MAKLHYTILNYFRERMENHSVVEKVTIWKNNDSEFMARIKRKSPLTDVVVHLSSAYRYSVMDYYTRPKEIKRGSYILIARPEATYTEAAWNEAKEQGIGIGMIGEFMGALTKADVSTYVQPQKKREWPVATPDAPPGAR